MTISKSDEASSELAMRRGMLELHPAGFGFVSTTEGSVYVARRDLRDALHGDEVELGCFAAARGVQGRVLRVIARTPRRLLGRVEGDSFVPNDERFGRSLRCAPDELARATPGMVCGATLGCGDLERAEVRIDRVFGPRGHARSEEDAVLWRERLDGEYPAAAVAEATAAARAGVDARGRTDLRSVPFVTIDPESAEDHDDALYAEEHDLGIRVLIAIADVASFVPPGGELDREARRRGTSVYLPGRVVPMLPAVLSADAASLRPNVDRPAIVLELVLGRDGELRVSRLHRALVRVAARLSYSDAAQVLRASDGRHAFGPMVVGLDSLARRLRAARRHEGALTLDRAESEVVVDETGQPSAIVRPQHDEHELRAHHLVEEMMLLANRTVGAMLARAGCAAPFRAHEAPDPARLSRVRETARRHGLEPEPDVFESAVALRGWVATLPEGPARADLSLAVLDGVGAAEYATAREEHFALAAFEYVHFTSPIRRYADLLVHRALEALRRDVAAPLLDAIERVNETQQRARTVQRDVAALHAAILMRHRERERFSGTLLRATSRELLIALEDPAVVVRCPRPRRSMVEGTRVTVRVENVSLGMGRIHATFLRALPATA